MKIEQSLSVKPSQTLTMTHQLQQSIQLLQMSNFELTSFIEQQLEENPFLEKSESLELVSEDNWQEESVENLIIQTKPIEWKHINTFDHIPHKTSSIENVQKQISFLKLTSKEKQIAEHLLEDLNVSGYYQGDILLTAKECQTTSQDILQVLEKLQTLEPTGIFARNLQECFALQLKEQGLYTPEFAKVVEYLTTGLTYDIYKIAKFCSLSVEECRKCFSLLKLLNPKPLLSLEQNDPPSTLIPDVYIRKNDEGEWKIFLNDKTLPQFYVHSDYYHKLRNQLKQKNDITFAKTKFKDAQWLNKAVHQRNQTLLTITKAIVEAQKLFFEKGIDFFTSLTLKHIAFITGFHESTISRICTNKYLATPFGIFELKYFFNSGLENRFQQENQGSRYVQERIRQLIHKENPKSPLSDQEIVKQLYSEGIIIARRTVTKYREKLRFLPSNKRRKHYMIHL